MLSPHHIAQARANNKRAETVPPPTDPSSATNSSGPTLRGRRNRPSTRGSAAAAAAVVTVPAAPKSTTNDSATVSSAATAVGNIDCSSSGSTTSCPGAKNSSGSSAMTVESSMGVSGVTEGLDMLGKAVGPPGGDEGGVSASAVASVTAGTAVSAVSAVTAPGVVPLPVSVSATNPAATIAASHTRNTGGVGVASGSEKSRKVRGGSSSSFSSGASGKVTDGNQRESVLGPRDGGLVCGVVSHVVTLLTLASEQNARPKEQLSTTVGKGCVRPTVYCGSGVAGMRLEDSRNC